MRVAMALALAVLLGCDGKVEQLSHDGQLFTLLDHGETGLLFSNPLKETNEDNHLVNDQFITGAGVAVGDVNNDSLPDLFFTGNQVPDRLYLNLGNLRFKDITTEAGIKLDQSWSKGVTMADVNGDGLLDIYVCKNINGQPELSANRLYINQGNLKFLEQAEEMGLADRGYSVQATFFDYDRDGALDLYLINQPPSKGNRDGNKINPLQHTSLLYSDKLYKLMPHGRYEDVSDYAGTRNFAYGLSATVSDFNSDGWPDIYVANDFDLPDHLYINQHNGTFKNTINQAVKHISNFSMGADAADYNNDGLMDIMVLDMVAEDHKRIKTFMGGMNPDDFWRVVKNGWHYQYMFNTLQTNNGNGTFSELAHLAGVSNTDWSWGPLFADFDNDGWKDLFVTNGVKRNMRHSDLDKKYSKVLDSLELAGLKNNRKLNELIDIMEFVEMAPEDPLSNFIYRNNGDLTFEKKMQEWGMGRETLSNGAAYADLDNDGDLDLVVSNIDDYVHLYRNNCVENSLGNFLRFQVVNQSGSPAYGAKVKLYRHGDLWQVQELSNARGFMSKSEDVLHFGLGSWDRCDSVVVDWLDGQQTLISNPEINQIILVKPQNLRQPKHHDPPALLFSDITDEQGLKHRHIENFYDDYAKEILLPHKMSNFGPGLAVGDVNEDGLQDFYVGGAAGQSGRLFLQSAVGGFIQQNDELWIDDALYEDLGAAMFDADGDGDLDLYVVSGGNEWEPQASFYQDRLYLNHGSGNFHKSTDALPSMNYSGSRVKPYDYDYDGDIDLFVGGRLDPGHYPRPGRSFLLENHDGVFKDVTDTQLPGLSDAGMVTDAVWSDLNGDGRIDLAVVGEWMPLKVWIQGDDGFSSFDHGLESSEGWYYAINSADMDADGDMDLVMGNLGLNYKYQASVESPFEVYYDDFDDNGRHDIVLSYSEHGVKVPVRGRSCSSQQIPELGEKFPTFEAFGDAGLNEIYGENLEQALVYQAFSFASAYLENQGDGKMVARPLPNQAQISSINSILIKDFNKDGFPDLLTAGNLYAAEIETPRNDANMGLFMKGDGEGNFNPVPLTRSGFFAPHDVKEMAFIEIGSSAQPAILVANNNYWLQLISINREANINALVQRIHTSSVRP